MWTVTALYTQQQEIFTVAWLVEITDGVNTARRGGETNLTYPEPYENLTEAQVIEWVKEALGADKVTEIETDLNDQILYMQTEPVKSIPLPWSQ
jgi:hypothetical protein